MAMQSSARIKGDDYQFLYTWLKVLDLKKKNTNVSRVRIEDPNAAFVDDVTVFYNDGTPPHYYQVKYHVDQRNAYTLELLIDKGKGKSLLEKFYKTYKEHLTDNPGMAARLHLVSNWAIDPKDKILSTVENEHSRLGDSIRSAAPGSDICKELKKVKDVLKIEDDELHHFLFTLCFFTGRDCTEEFKDWVQGKMESLGLKSSENDLTVAIQIVRDWVKKKHVEVDLNILEKVLQEKDLYAPPSGPQSATVYLVTVKKHQFDLEPDFVIDLRKYYANQGEIKGHELLNGFDYNKTLLPRIRSVQKKVNDETRATLIKARGFSRLSAWFSFGHTFSQVSGYTIEVNQNNRLWRTDDKAHSNFKLISQNGNGETLGSVTGTAAVGISITGSIEADVRDYIAREGNVGALLLLRPESELGAGCLQSAGDVVALCQQFKTLTRDFVRNMKAEKLLLFYFGPLSGACFIGHQLNAICKEIQIMEKLADEGYVKSFSLV
jgi:hypothetical protein